LLLLLLLLLLLVLLSSPQARFVEAAEKSGEAKSWVSLPDPWGLKNAREKASACMAKAQGGCCCLLSLGKWAVRTTTTTTTTTATSS
jgi:hypothetical protein